MAGKSSPSVELDELLAAEFDYIAQTATQANEDRARVSSFYMIAVGSLIATLLGTQFLDSGFFTPLVDFMLSGIFILLTLLGSSTVVQLARLRAAWHDSMLAMNHLKDFAVKLNPELMDAFLWRTETLPPKFKDNSISNYQAVEVSVISGITCTAAVIFLQFGLGWTAWIHWAVSLFAGAIAFRMQRGLYRRNL